MKPAWVAIQRNPNSGSGRRRLRLLELISSLRRLGIRPRVYSRREQLDRRLADPGDRDGLLCIVAAGGDGTVADVVNRFPGIPVMPFAMGTENLLARFLHIPERGESAAEVIRRGRTRVLDAGMVDQRRFLLMASAGFDGDVVHRLHLVRQGNISRFTYFKPLWESTFNYQYPVARVYLDDAREPLSGCLVMVFNVPTYGLGLPIVPHARCDDGLLDIAVFPDPGSLRLIGYGLNVMTGLHTRHAEQFFHTARRIRIESDAPIPIQADGDPAGATPVTIHIEPATMEFVIP